MNSSTISSNLLYKLRKVQRQWPRTDRFCFQSWNNGKSGAKLVLTSSTTAGLQIHKFDHSRTANPCDWLLCRRAALPLVGFPHSIVYLHLPVVEGLIFFISVTPHLGTSFPLFHGYKCYYFYRMLKYIHHQQK